MLKNKTIWRALSFAIILVMIFGTISSFVYGESKLSNSVKVGLSESTLTKIEPSLIKDLENEDFIEILAYMKEQVDTEIVANSVMKRRTSFTPTHTAKLEVRKEVIKSLKNKAQRTQINILDYLEREKKKGNVIEYRPYYIVNMIYVKANRGAVEKISTMRDVEKIYKNQIHKIDDPIISNINNVLPSSNGLEWNVERVKANEVWDLGYDGNGVVVGLIDSGATWNHPALMEKWRGYDIETGEVNPIGNWFDAVAGQSMPYDIENNPHGTHVLGTILGQEPNGTNKIGVAPGAKWIAAKAFTEIGGTDAQLLAAGEWMLAPGGDPTKAPDILNNSWGGGSGINDWYRNMVRNWRSAGILPVFAAGNQRYREPAPGPGSITVPSNYPESFAVAATDRNNVRGSFSKLGPSPYEPTMFKPNISAPGVGIRSSVPGGYESGWNGTSMAAPAISGVAALMLSANSSLTVDEIEDIMESTATALTDSKYPEAPNMAYGYGLVNALEAVLTAVPKMSPRIIYPGNLSYTNQDNMIIEGIVESVSKINIYVNDEKVATINAESKLFEVEVNLPSDENAIVVTSEVNGIETDPSNTIVIIKDKEAPILAIDEPLDNVKINQEEIYIIGNVYDNVWVKTLRINDVEVKLDSEGNFCKRLTVAFGENTIIIRARDEAGNESVLERIVIVARNMENLPANSVIINREAFDIRYLDNNEEAQAKLRDWQSQGNIAYVKLNKTTLVNENGELVSDEVLPEELTYYGAEGNTELFIK